MIIWSPVSVESLFVDPFQSGVPWREVAVGDVTMLCSPLENGMGRVERLISPRPADYLKPEWQPGSVIPLWPI